ncbi:hypothetical protein OQA88_411 [Cercophora sp. LCS_1]
MAEDKSSKSKKLESIPLPARAYGFPVEAFDWSHLPDVDTNFLPTEHLEAFIQALSAPDPVHSPGVESTSLNSPASSSLPRQLSNASSFFDFSGSRSSQSREATPAPDLDVNNNNNTGDVTTPLRPPHRTNSGSLFISAQSDWAPVHEKVLGSKNRRRSKHRNAGAVATAVDGGTGKRKRRGPRVPLEVLVGSRSKDETREGYLYNLLKWPFLLIVGAWILGLSVAYLATRFYIFCYEQGVAWRGKREKLRRAMRATGNYREWVVAAKAMDEFFGNGRWKEENEFAYYDSKTVRRVGEQMRRCRERAERAEGSGEGDKGAVEDLKALIEACVKNNFVGVENPRLYSQTYYGTKNLVQGFVGEVERSLRFLISTKQLSKEEKRTVFKGITANYGRTALCLSGGATFAYYHFGVVKALLEEDLLPDIITGTSGGALVAALVATRTNEELKELLVPALAHKITACREPLSVWFRRWWKTGARFDSVDWAKQCSWWTRGSMTFREAYERTGRILNVSCVPADPHSPTILCNYLTSPDCVIWSAVIASAAVPGILNPVVLMMKTRGGQLAPYSFGHKWKDGSLRTDIPIKALNLHFNVNFTLVSQVNPHINLFFFSSRGSVGQPVTHRKGRGWRGGYLGSATEQYIKLDLTKWLRVLRQLELLPRPLGQDWSQLWLQTFGGNITIWPKSILSDFMYILTDPDEARLARMIHEGQQSAFPKLKFVSNRLRVERLAERGRRETRPGGERRGSIESIISEDDLREVLKKVERGGDRFSTSTGTEDETTDVDGDGYEAAIDGDDGIGSVLDGSRDDSSEGGGKIATPAGLAVVEK